MDQSIGENLNTPAFEKLEREVKKPGYGTFQILHETNYGKKGFYENHMSALATWFQEEEERVIIAWMARFNKDSVERIKRICEEVLAKL